MKIAYLSRGNTPHDRRFLEKMVDRGHNVHFISYFADSLVDVSGVITHHFSDRQVVRFPRFRSLQIARHLKSLLQKLKPDILHSGWLPDHGFFGALAGFHPTLSMAWGSDVLVCPDISASSAWRIRFALMRADHIIADAQNVKAKILDMAGCAPNKVSIFPFGIDLELFQPSARGATIRQALEWEDREIIISTRNLRPVYGIEHLVKALALAVTQRPQLGMILAGAGELEAELRRLVDGLGLRDHVRFVGTLDPQSMADYLNAADLYMAVPSSDGTSLSLLEAMACGLPVIVSDIPANREWVQEGENGYLSRPADHADLAQKMVRLLKDHSLRQKMKEQNLQVAKQKANWNNNFSFLEGIYSSLIEANPN